MDHPSPQSSQPMDQPSPQSSQHLDDSPFFSKDSMASDWSSEDEFAIDSRNKKKKRKDVAPKTTSSSKSSRGINQSSLVTFNVKPPLKKKSGGAIKPQFAKKQIKK